MKKKTQNDQNSLPVSEKDVERIKKSKLNARDTFDYEKLVYDMPGLLQCSYEEEPEEIIFTYLTEGKRPLADMKYENKEKQYQFLINFSRLQEIHRKYKISFRTQNLYYDENMMVYAKKRDIYPRGEEPEEAVFLEHYKAIICGVLNRKYTIDQLQESGLVLLKGNKNFQEIIQAASVNEVEKFIGDKKEAYLKKQVREKRIVSRTSYRVWRFTAVAALIGMTAAGGYSLYANQKVIPKQRAVIETSQAYINNDYTACIDSAKPLSVEEMDSNTKYILAVAYANAESFKKEEIDNIVAKLSPTSNEKELEYWIRLGRLETGVASDLALSLSDDKLLIYSYMKELDLLESNTELSGEEKKSRIDKLEQEITKLGKKYETVQEENPD